jgi:hypothetical protein
MRRLRYFTPPAAVAQPRDGSTTECATPGNVQINATPSEPTYLYPWDDEFYGPGSVIGGDGAHGR